MSASRRRVAYYYDADVGSYTYGHGHVMKPHRMRITHDLVTAYDMLDKMQVLRAQRCPPEKMTAFHTDEYVHFLHRVTPDTMLDLTYNRNRFLTLDDNPAFDGLYEFCSISAGGSIAAAQRIACGAADIAINWAGGLHHAKKREASGFCYINDIVLCILELLRTFPRVLYIDIDVHHGDGVEEAFYTTDRVMTCSFHKFGEFFPGTGSADDLGFGRGTGYAVNVPLKDGITDDSYKSVFQPVIEKIMQVFRPSAVVLQCGADSLAGDKLGGFNMTMQGHAECVRFLRQQNVPLVLLGGGGYTVKNVARAWTYETACALGIEDTIDPHLPWNEYFDWFGPRYRLEVQANNMEDINIKDGSLDIVRANALRQLDELVHVPSVQMHDVPRETLGEHLGFVRPTEDEAYDQLDEDIARHSRMLYKMQEAEADSDSDSESSSRSRHGRHGPFSRTDSSSHYRDSHSYSNSHRDEQSQSRPKSGRTRMSIVSNQYVELAPVEAGTEFADFAGFDPHRPTVRRFFGAVDVPTWEEQQQQQQGIEQGQRQPDGGDRDQEDWENADVSVSASGNMLANCHANGYSKERERSVGEEGSDDEMDAVAPSESNE